MQTIKRIVVKLIKITAVCALIVLAALIALDHFFPVRYSNCERYTKWLNGGLREYEGKKFNIVLCGAGWDKNRMNDWVRLQVWSEHGSLLAQRTFLVDWDSNFPRDLEYNKDHLTYYDASQQDDFVHHITMPPTWWDWVRARLPLLD